jgi:23S rRNA (cytosine1962-C5)-methyltransferase
MGNCLQIMSLSTVLLKPGEADRVVAGHPWVYSSSILRLSTPASDGDVVQVKDHRQRLIGVGFYNSRSKIAVRVLDPDRIEVNQAFFEQRIQAALNFRKRHQPGVSSYRVVNAEGDFLSGLIVDKYEDVLVVQTSSLGMERHKSEIVGALKKLLSPKAIVERNDIASRKFEGLEDSNEVLFGSLPEGGKTSAVLSGLKFEVDLKTGHKTGLYLDQQLNHAAVARYAKGADVLDTFTFLGGFALHAAKAGARHVIGVDQSADAIAAAKRHAEVNGLTGNCSFEVGNVFDWLTAATLSKEGAKPEPRFDLIILDPPSFTRNRASVPDALRGYKEIHLRALKLLKPGGILATFCCSHHVPGTLFLDTFMAAAFDAHKIVRQVAFYSQSPDHPIVPMIPETEYLKGFAFELVR